MNFKSTFLYGFCFMLCESNNIATYASSMPASFSDTVTISNPMLWDDVPDPDIIRVGSDFYMVSTTMHLMPGAPIMKSHDLKHWKTIGYIFNRLTDSPKYNMIKGTVYGRGQWATSLKYHNGKFYALFAPNDNPGGDTYIYTSVNGEKWTLVSRLPHFHDASLFFDDDNRVYVFSGTGHITELTSDLTHIKQNGLDQKLFDRDNEETGLLEGSRMIKRNHKYYLLMVSWPKGMPRRQVCFRADNLMGPWEKKIILESKFGGFYYVGQGTIVDTNQGNWYGVIFQDRGGVGRVLTLNPCHWVNDWPMLGDSNGKVPSTVKVIVDHAGSGKPQSLVDNENFNETQHPYDLFLHNWEWNHNPIDTDWSLKERKGWLRLKTSKICHNIFDARNTLTQRMEGPASTAYICMDISHMKDGDYAGFAAFQGDAAMLQICKDGNKRLLHLLQSSVTLDPDSKSITHVKDSIQASIELKNSIIYLRIDADFNVNKDIATFYYSYNKKDWHQLGGNFKMIYDYRRLFMGTRYAIYNYSTKNTGGWIDVDYFNINTK